MYVNTPFLAHGQTRYTAVDGTPALKAAIISKFKRENALDYTATEVMVSSGGKQVFYTYVKPCLMLAMK